MANENLFAHPEDEKEKVDLVEFITDPDEQKKLLAESRAARKQAEEMLKEENGVTKIDLVQFATPSDGSDKKYLLLFDGEARTSGQEVRDWQIAHGRRNAYELIKIYMENEEITYDLKRSKILVDVEQFKDAKTMFDFMDYVIENDLMGPNEVYPHLDEYYYDDEEDDEEEVEE